MLASASYDAKRGYRIDVVDPGAVPGRSTTFRNRRRQVPLRPCFAPYGASQGFAGRSFAQNQICFANLGAKGGGPETGSTRVIKASGGVRNLLTVTGLLIVANDNSQFVAANDNSVVAGDVRKAA